VPIRKFLWLALLALAGCAAPASTNVIHLANGDPKCMTGQFVTGMSPMACSGGLATGVENVTTFGATGQGLVTDAPSSQAAINAAGVSHSTGFGGNDNGTQVVFPPGYYLLDYPLWLNQSGVSLVGMGTFASALGPTYDFGPTIVATESTYAGMPTHASLVTGAGAAFDFTQNQLKYWLNLREWDGVNGPFGTHSGLNMNGLGAFSIEAFVNDKTAGDGTIVSSGGTPDSVTGFVQAFQLGINGGNWQARFLTTTNGYLNTAGAVSLNTLEYLLFQYTGSHYCIYVCTPGSTNCAVTASGTATGTLIQNPLEDVTIGPQAAISPNSSREGNAINGYIDSVRISSVARYSAGGLCDTIASVPNAKLTADANTLILTNGEKDPNGLTVKAYDGASTYGWLFPYNITSATGVSRISISNLAINPTQFKDVSGIIAESVHDSQFGPLYMTPNIEAPIEMFNLSYNNNHVHDIYAIGPGRFGIANLGGGFNQFDNLRMRTYFACYDMVIGSGSLRNALCADNTGGGVAYRLITGGGANVDDYSPANDFENGGNMKANVLQTGGGNVQIHGGALATTDNAPLVWMDGGGNATLTGTALGATGTPSEIVHSTGTAGTVQFTNSQFASGLSAVSIDDVAGVSVVTPCKGKVTLSSGSGTFTNTCVRANSQCGVSAAHTCTPTVSAGSVALSGTGSDVCSINCN